MVCASVNTLTARLLTTEEDSVQNIYSILSLCLDALAKACVTTVFAAIQTRLFPLLSDMWVSGCVDSRDTRQGFGMLDVVENCTKEMKMSSVLSLPKFLASTGNESAGCLFFLRGGLHHCHIQASSVYENAAIVQALSAQSSCCMAIWSFATVIVEKLVTQSCNCSSAVERLSIEDEKQSMQCSENESCLAARLTRTTTSHHTLEEYSGDSCSVHNDDRFLQSPDTSVIMNGNEISAWIAVAKNKDDEEEDDDEDDDEDEDNDDDAEEGSGEEEEGEEELEGEEGDEDEEGGEDDDDEGDEGEEGEDGEEGEEEVGDEEEEEDGVEGEEEEDGGGDEDDGYDEDEGDEDEDEEDEDEEDKDETSEPPKKKRK